MAVLLKGGTEKSQDRRRVVINETVISIDLDRWYEIFFLSLGKRILDQELTHT